MRTLTYTLIADIYMNSFNIFKVINIYYGGLEIVYTGFAFFFLYKTLVFKVFH